MDGYGNKLVTVFARHPDNFQAKEPGTCPELCSGNYYSLYSLNLRAASIHIQHFTWVHKALLEKFN